MLQVVQDCGSPQRGSTRTRRAPATWEEAGWPWKSGAQRVPEVHPTSSGGASLRQMVWELNERLSRLRGFWTKLPLAVCADARMAADISQDAMPCWTGAGRGRYMAPVVGTSSELLENPELDGENPSPDLPTRRRRLQLRSATTRMKAAALGRDLELEEWDEDASGSGEGQHFADDWMAGAAVVPAPARPPRPPRREGAGGKGGDADRGKNLPTQGSRAVSRPRECPPLPALTSCGCTVPPLLLQSAPRLWALSPRSDPHPLGHMGSRSPSRTLRLWGPRSLGVALGVFMTIGFALQLCGGPFQRRLPGLQLLQPWTSSPQPASLSCPPRQHLVFLKTHKSGSSSVLNLLHRYGDRHGLRFALPARYQFGYPRPFQASRVKGYHPQDEGTPSSFHILCHHMRFNLKEVLRVMPSDSFFFSIVRDPAAMARSAFSYYRSTSPAFRKAPSLAAFLANPRAFYQPGARGDHYARNLLWFDFGLPIPPEMRPQRGNLQPPNPPYTPDPNALFQPAPTMAQGHGQTSSPASVSSSFMQWSLAWLDSVFDLVLVSEYFDESLVLLADALCWELDDVVGFMHNAQAWGQPAEEDGQLAARARAWNSLDWTLYLHFNRSLWARAKQYGRGRLESAVAELRARREALAKHCLVGGKALDPQYITDRRFRPFQFGSGKVLGYVLRSGLSSQAQEECELLATPELQYKDKLDAKQFPPTAALPLKTSSLLSP
ncbi:galactose-3-O-sulfotransferase 4 isoform X2 [Erinaceus europaeus]|uniref:Galactose-3-O-sulfotransferase 4 isoform X2 n=1 Tax=Erinaceus europaeus TaxID=9365 RepID=A0ABM3VYG3_ERIEU|nr:galactose-3-O-sulfotransferase 4 isoform X2 [Erinaceus europaeus]